jgi:hypothetical protein
LKDRLRFVDGLNVGVVGKGSIAQGGMQRIGDAARRGAEVQHFRFEQELFLLFAGQGGLAAERQGRAGKQEQFAAGPESRSHRHLQMGISENRPQ